MIAAGWLLAAAPALAGPLPGAACSGWAHGRLVTGVSRTPDAPAATLERMASEAHRRGADEEAVQLWMAAASLDAGEDRPASRSENLLRAGQALAGLGYSSEA